MFTGACGVDPDLGGATAGAGLSSRSCFHLFLSDSPFRNATHSRPRHINHYPIKKSEREAPNIGETGNRRKERIKNDNPIARPNKNPRTIPPTPRPTHPLAGLPNHKSKPVRPITIMVRPLKRSPVQTITLYLSLSLSLPSCPAYKATNQPLTTSW